MIRIINLILVVALVRFSTVSNAQTKNEPIVLQTQGGFAVGGKTVSHGGKFDMANFFSPEGQTAYGDHAYAFYQVPVNARKYPLVFLHGGGQTKRTWETTPDGRDGFQNIFLRRRFSVYLIDQPRRGEAGVSTVPVDETFLRGIPNFSNRALHTLFRLGEWPNYYPGVQFPKDPESLNQFIRQGTIDLGKHDVEVAADAMGELFNKIGSGILVTHSVGGTIGWRTVLRTKNVKAIVAYEPGGGQYGPFLFPKGEAPEAIPTAFGPITPLEIELSEFKKLTKMPIIIYYGDNIATEPVTDVGRDQWRGELQMARYFAQVINKHGGDCTVVHLPEVGIKGNTHFPFSDLNNLEVADHLSAWLKEKKLDVK